MTKSSEFKCGVGKEIILCCEKKRTRECVISCKKSERETQMEMETETETETESDVKRNRDRE